MEIITKSAEETFRLGEKVGSNIGGKHIFALSGEMGAGKTVFLQGFTKGLGIKNKIVSPTFILMRSYRMNGQGLMANGQFFHLDLYRLEGNVAKQVEDLGLLDIWQDKKNIIAIEWAEKIQDILPRETVWVRFESLDEIDRRITIEGLNEQ